LERVLEAVLLVLEGQIEIFAQKLEHALALRRVDERRVQRQQEEVFLLFAFAAHAANLCKTKQWSTETSKEKQTQRDTQRDRYQNVAAQRHIDADGVAMSAASS
jgi:hypothetical protein